MIKLKELLNEANVIQKIDKLAKANKYGTVDGTRMNGKTAREIMAIFKHPKMNSYRNQMLGMKSHELADLTVTLVKTLKIKVESVNEAIEQETNISFEMIGKSYISVKGRKLTAKLQFKGNDLQDVVNGKKKKGKVVLASLVIK